MGTSFSRTASLSPMDYTNTSYIITPQNASAFRSIPGVETVDTRLIATSQITGFVKAHFASNQDTGENINTQIIPEVETGTAQALIVGINANSAIVDCDTSDEFLQPASPIYTISTHNPLLTIIFQNP